MIVAAPILNSAQAEQRLRPGSVVNVVASHYGHGDGFHNQVTANCTIFSANKRTAAHRKLPFGTVVSLTNQNTGVTERVTITDRGPYVKGRDIDVASSVGFRLFGDLGVAELLMKVLSIPEKPVIGRACIAQNRERARNGDS